MFEPGKFLVSEAGSFLAKVNVVKQTTSTVFASIDSGFNHLIRPMMYDSYHHIHNISNPNFEFIEGTPARDVIKIEPLYYGYFPYGNTNNSIENIAYVIPGNDDSIRAIKLYAASVADSILEGKSQAANVTSKDEFVEVEEKPAKEAKAKKAPAKKVAAAKEVPVAEEAPVVKEVAAEAPAKEAVAEDKPEAAAEEAAK